jgi:hypothetical protein
VHEDPKSHEDPEEPAPVDQTSKAIPALKLLKETLGDRYVFYEDDHLSSWNQNDLELPTKRKIVLPMADTVARSLLTALEQTFGPKAQTQDPRKAVKKFWPCPWAKPSAKIPFIQRIAPFAWTGRYFAELGLRLPHPPALPKAFCPRSLREVELQAPKGIRASSAVEISLQGMQVLLG